MLSLAKGADFIGSGHAPGQPCRLGMCAVGRRGPGASHEPRPHLPRQLWQRRDTLGLANGETVRIVGIDAPGDVPFVAGSCAPGYTRAFNDAQMVGWRCSAGSTLGWFKWVSSF